MIIRMNVVADLVLSCIEAQAPTGVDFYLDPYKNSRENGWAICADQLTPDRKAAFTEDRNSGEIVVYVGRIGDFARAGNVPNDKAYAARRYFALNQVDEAARYILAAILPEPAKA